MHQPSKNLTECNLQLKKEIETALHSKLQGAHLYSLEPPSVFDFTDSPFLYMNVILKIKNFHVSDNFHKVVVDPISEESGLIETWNERSNSSKNHNGDLEHIQYAVLQYMDRFIDEYLRVNADACVHR